MALSPTCLWATVAELKPWLTFGPQDVAHDAMLETRANAVTEEIERETGRIYVSRSVVDTIDGPGHGLLYLTGYPVTALTSITVDGTAVDADDYVLDAAAGIVKKKSGVWARGVGNHVATYTAGYARASLPASVLTLGIDLLRARYLTWSSNADVYQSVQMGGTSLAPQADWISIRKQIDALRCEHRVGVA